MTDFKLLAVRALTDCSEKYSKVIQRGRIYPFYQGYQFLNKGGGRAAGNDVVNTIIVPDGEDFGDLHNFTSADGHLVQLNISAIVGENGSGKSGVATFE